METKASVWNFSRKSQARRPNWREIWCREKKYIAAVYCASKKSKTQYAANSDKRQSAKRSRVNKVEVDTCVSYAQWLNDNKNHNFNKKNSDTDEHRCSGNVREAFVEGNNTWGLFEVVWKDGNFIKKNVLTNLEKIKNELNMERSNAAKEVYLTELGSS